MNGKTIHDSKEVTTELLFKSFNNTATDAEEAMISGWLEESEENKKKYLNASALHEALLMNAPAELFEGRQPESLQKKRNTLRFVWLCLGNAAALLLFCVLGYNLLDNRFENRLAETMNTVVVPAGRSMDYILSDGTSVRLNSGASLSFPVSFGKHSREVHLDGEAYFNVAHNAARPFIVRTFASDIEVLGTEFNVNADEESGIFYTTLVEGSVKLTSHLDGQEFIMIPDQTVSLMQNGSFKVENKAARSRIRWTEGIMAVDTHDFADLMKKLETAFGVDIIIESETTPELDYIRGEFRISDGIDAVMRILQDMTEFDYRKDYRTGTIYIY